MKNVLNCFLFWFLFCSFLNKREFVSRLQKANKTVYLITGGFDCLIEPVADELGIPLDHMFANKLFFHFNGTFLSRNYHNAHKNIEHIFDLSKTHFRMCEIYGAFF